MRLAKVEKHGETKVIQHLEVALCQSCKRREEEKAEEVSAQICTSNPVSVQALPSLTLLICTFQIIKEEEKKEIIILYISVVVFLCYTTPKNVLHITCF